MGFPPFPDTDGFRARITGVSGTATSGTTTYVDHHLTEERYLNGIGLILNNHVLGDTARLQIVDIDNVLGYGANFVVDEFVTNYNVIPDSQSQGIVYAQYPAKIYAGLYIRIKYTSTGGSNVDIKINYFLHKRL